jgi:putative DNA-invertase from lambdoid prophage Rac
MSKRIQSKRGATSSTEPRVFGYVRVSTDAQAQQGHSLADQESRIRGYAQSLGLTVQSMFIEAGVSASKKLSVRPKGAELLSSLRSGDHVISTKLDRMFRSASDALNVAAEFREKGIRLHLLDIGGEVTGTGAAKLVFSVLAAVAEMERERIGERVRSVKQHLRDGGYFTGGRVARGFSVSADGKLIQDARWQKCLAAMKHLRRDGTPYRTIAERVRKDFGLSVDSSTVHRILNGKREIDSARVA